MTQEGQAEAWQGNRSKFHWILYESSVLRCAVGWQSFLQTCPTSEATFAAETWRVHLQLQCRIPAQYLEAACFDASTLGCFGCGGFFTVGKPSNALLDLWSALTDSTALLFSPYFTLRSERESMDLTRAKKTRTVNVMPSCHLYPFIHLQYSKYLKILCSMQYTAMFGWNLLIHLVYQHVSASC